MNTNIKRLLDPRQRTNQNNASNNVKEIEMKTRKISKKAILGLAIGTGLIAGFSVLLNGSETRAFNPAEAARAKLPKPRAGASPMQFIPHFQPHYALARKHPVLYVQ